MAAKKNLEIKTKLLNQIMISGNKKTSEKLLTKTFKQLQKTTLKPAKKILQLAVINSSPIFKLHKIKNKRKKVAKIKEIPAFIASTNNRTSLALKLILLVNKENKKSGMKFSSKFEKEMLLASQQKGTAVEVKNSLQKQVLLKKHLFTFYRWK